MKFGIEVLH